MRKDTRRHADDVSVVVILVVLVGTALWVGSNVFSLQPGRPQKGRLSDVEGWSSEGTCSSYIEDY